MPPGGSRGAAAGIGLSRVFGLVREVLIGVTLGVTPATEAFRVAMRVPNIVQNMLGEGTMSAAFVPVYARLIEEREYVEARRLAGGVLGFVSLAVFIIVLVLIVATGPIISLTTLGQLDPEIHAQAVRLTRITAPGIGLLGISAWCLGILNANREYFLGYVAPVLWNLAQILTLGVVTLGALAFGTDLAAETMATLLAVAVAIGSALQLGVQAPRVWALTQGVTPHLRREGRVGVVLKRSIPAMGARGVVQISSFVDLMLAAALASGAIAVVTFVAPLYLLPISVFGFSVAVTELTEMSRQSHRQAIVHHRVELGLRKVALPAGLVTAVLAAGAPAIINTLYTWPGRQLGFNPISAGQAQVMALTLAVFALGLPATMSARISQNALYALGDVRTPARIAVARLAVLVAVTVTVMFQFDRLLIDPTLGSGLASVTGWGDLPARFWDPLPAGQVDLDPVGAARLGPVGIAIGALSAAWAEWALLRRALQGHLGRSFRSGLALAVIAAALGTAATVALIQAVVPIGAPIQGVVVGLAGIATYIGLLRFQGLAPRRSP